MATTAIITATTAAEAIRKGYNEITLSEWTTGNKPAIKIGSGFEMSGTVYQTSTADEDPDPAAAFAGLAAGLVYCYATDTAGTITFSVSSTAPTWDEDKQGYYNGAARCLFQTVKAGANWNQKTIYKSRDYGIISTGINIGLGANSDRSLRTASDAEIKWEEANSWFLTTHTFKSGYIVIATVAGITENFIYDNILIKIPNIGDFCVITGNATKTGLTDVLNFHRAVHNAVDQITLYFYNNTSKAVESYVCRNTNTTEPFATGELIVSKYF